MLTKNDMENEDIVITNEDICNSIDNNGVRLDNIQEDMVRLGIGVNVFLLAILIVGIIALSHFW